MPAHPKVILEKNLRELYLGKKLSTDAIGKIFGCDHVTVLNYLQKYNIPRRTRLGNRQPVSISKQLLINLYLKRGLTQKQIAKKFGHSNYGIQRWMKIYGIKGRSYYESHRVGSKHNFDGDLTEKAYLIGFRLGDLNVSRVRKLIQIRCSTTIQDQVDLIETLYKKYGHIHIWKAKRGTFEIVVLLNESFLFLLPKEDKIKKWILSKQKCFLSFFAGYADAEGSYYLRQSTYSKNSRPWAIFEIQTYDKNILGEISRQLSFLGIENKYYLSRPSGKFDKRGVKNNKDSWRVVINKKQSLWNFLKLIVTFHKHKGKLCALERVKENILKRNMTKHCQKILL